MNNDEHTMSILCGKIFFQKKLLMHKVLLLLENHTTVCEERFGTAHS